MKKILLFILFIAPAFAHAQPTRAIELLGGVAINDGNGGYHLSVAAGPRWQHFGFATYTSFINTPSDKFSNWTIIGLQTKVFGGESDIKPYGVFDFGLFNFQTINDDANMRTASLDLGTGIDKEMKNGNGLLFDARIKWFVDYASKREPIKILTFSAGIRF